MAIGAGSIALASARLHCRHWSRDRYDLWLSSFYHPGDHLRWFHSFHSQDGACRYRLVQCLNTEHGHAEQAAPLSYNVAYPLTGRYLSTYMVDRTDSGPTGWLLLIESLQVTQWLQR